ncbi:GCN5 family acetyltransferase [Virgibacillus pantothenticus]|uniref:GCN5 family acetyltransferase n=1 Tax=Virgibacillus pantothenticus TaxID=1473 RepID=A0A0L0QQR2_VIRPA|nr:GCN5 family acetyltransferase [Virgibacillus pantothenticus]
MLLIRKEQPSDYKQTEDVIQQAFQNVAYSNGKEHELVRALRTSNEFVPELSLVSKQGKTITGHILFTTVEIKNAGNSLIGLSLAPLSVLPEYQNQGIGTALITFGLTTAARLDFSVVVVLGHKEYYPKFGFVKASAYNIKPPFAVEDDLYMVKELQAGVLTTTQGTVHYSPVFML